jgi:hypothetical protein
LLHANLQRLERQSDRISRSTGLTHEEFARLLPAFEAAYAVLHPVDKTAEGKARQCQPGGGTKGTLRAFADKLLDSPAAAGAATGPG